MKIKKIIKFGMCCVLLQSTQPLIYTAAPVEIDTTVKKPIAKVVPISKTAPKIDAATKSATKAATPPAKTTAAKAIVSKPKTAAAKTVTPPAPLVAAVKATPVVSAEQIAKSTSILTSIYIQNTFNTDATLNEIEIVIANQKSPLVKKDLTIKVPGKKSVYDKGSMVSFDIAADSKDYAMFNGVKSITIDKNKIVFNTLQTAFQSSPIKITNKNNTWVADNS